MSADGRPWTKQFQIQSEVDLDFVIGQSVGFPVGMQRGSPPEFRRRVLAGAISYRAGLKSIDYALKRYVANDLYEDEDQSLGDKASDYLRDSTRFLMEEMRLLHTAYPTFGVLGAELTLFRVPNSLDTARMLANRGLLLEVLPILRLCLEMMAWSNVAFHLQDENKVIALKAQACIPTIKSIFPAAGKLYGYLSTFSHWGHAIHGHFLDTDSKNVWVLNASVRYRAMSLALCIVILDLLVEVVRKFYSERSDSIVDGIQGIRDYSTDRKAYRLLSDIVATTGLDELVEIRSFMSAVR